MNLSFNEPQFFTFPCLVLHDIRVLFYASFPHEFFYILVMLDSKVPPTSTHQEKKLL